MRDGESGAVLVPDEEVTSGGVTPCQLVILQENAIAFSATAGVTVMLPGSLAVAIL